MGYECAIYWVLVNSYENASAVHKFFGIKYTESKKF